VARFELTLSEQKLNQLLQDGLAEQTDVPVTDVTVRLQRDLIVAGGRARVGFLTMNVEIDATLAAEDGELAPEIVEVRAAGQPLTGYLRAQVENMIAPYLQQWPQIGSNVVVEEAEIEEGQIRIAGRFEK
jgi:hypothetical protein